MKLLSRSAARLSRVGRRSGSLLSTGTFFRRQLWIRPLIGAAVLAGIAWWVNRAVEGGMREHVAAALITIRDADVTALRIWMKEQEANAQVLAMSERVRPAVRELITLGERPGTSDADLRQSPRQAELRAFLGPRMKVFGYTDFFVNTPSARVVGANQDAPIGMILKPERAKFIQKILQGKPSVSRPFRSSLLFPDEHGELRAGLPTMATAAPVPDDSGRPFAVLQFRIRPEAEFTQILQVARSGESGETFAFDDTGLLLSQSRFDDDLKRVGLLADLPDSHSVLTLELRDPGVNMMEGERPAQKRADQPLTKVAASAIAGETGVNVTGFRDYRGVPSVAAWTWLPEYEMGVAVKGDAIEAFQTLSVVRRAFQGLFGLLVLSAAGVFVYMVLAARHQRAALRAALEVKQLGQYALEDKIGAGGMGSVYRARHALLRRPTAVKLLDPDKVSPVSIARFEREVQLTSQLNHPNTITIYDYGRTPEGIFYYAMEYLEGIDLDELVERFGPIPEGRVLHILRQVCGSLAEAHAIGLIHRDIKPANLILTCRGGVYDLLKVLDFGLVKALGGEQEVQLTATHSLTGTPRYLSPEAIERPDTVDARTDIYAMGAVAYYLLTGTPVFTATTLVELCMQHVKETPEPPSQRLKRPVSPDLENVILRCLAKKPEDRPDSAAVLLGELEKCKLAHPWTSADARAWWEEFKRSQDGAPTRAVLETTGLVQTNEVTRFTPPTGS
jgi:eukaryotic-like serine/threonine-protein kinase